MRFSLRPGLSYCLIDGRPIFLDTDQDRYFRLSEPLEDAFLAHLAEGGGSTRPQTLLEHAILVPGTATMQPHLGMPRPSRSVIELTAGGVAAKPASAWLVFALVWSTRRRLRRRPLNGVLESVVRERDSARLPIPLPLAVPHAIAAAAGFSRSRRYVPFEPSCLLDSLALMRYLTRHGIAGSIVFGVTDSPFAAHCWVQVGDVVLNDTVGNTMSYMPIRVI